MDACSKDNGDGAGAAAADGAAGRGDDDEDEKEDQFVLACVDGVACIHVCVEEAAEGQPESQEERDGRLQQLYYAVMSFGSHGYFWSMW